MIDQVIKDTLDPDIKVALTSLEEDVRVAERFIPEDAGEAKIPSFIGAICYVRGCTFIESSIKHHILVLHKCKGISPSDEEELHKRLKGLKTPKYSEVKKIFQSEFGYDIQGIFNSQPELITRLDQLIRGRHLQAHSTADIISFIQTLNRATVYDFKNDFVDAVIFISHICRIKFNPTQNKIEYI